MRRPEPFSRELCDAVAVDLYPMLRQWYPESNPDSAEEERYVRQLSDALWTSLGDGYAAAKYLDEISGWDIDSDAVKVLSEAAWKLRERYEKEVARWVSERDLKPALRIGDEVGFEHNRALYRGEIAQVDEKHGTYWVFSAALGHVKEGTGSHSIILPYEAVEKV